jgi:ABC-type uncharacterized transport system ATPase subunit
METRNFGQVLRRVVRNRGCGILLVEHDMTLVRELCDQVYVLDFGSLIFEGTPDEMRASSIVRSAYLGEEITHNRRSPATAAPQGHAAAAVHPAEQGSLEP